MDSPAHHADLLAPALAPTQVPVAPAPSAPALAPIQREHDSIDDFEHLDRDGSPPRDAKPPPPPPVSSQTAPPPSSLEADLLGMLGGGGGGGDHRPSAPQQDPMSAVQSFLDTEREELTVSPAHANPAAPEDPHFSDSREELSPAPSDDSLPDAIENFVSPPSPARAAPQAAPREESPVPPIVPKVETPPPAPVEVSAPVPVQVSVPAPAPVSVSVTAPVSTPAPAPAPAPQATTQPLRPVTEAEVIFCQMGLDAWFNPGRLHPKVESLVYWRSPAKSGIALGAGLVLLLALACCSLISVLAYTSLLALSATTGFRIYSCVLQAIQKTSDGHPFKEFLETDLSISPERAQELAVLATAHLNAAANELRRLFLVEDLVDSLKFGVSLWCLTYLGAWFNGMTLLIIGYVALFTLPKVYETNKAQIDANLDLVSAKFQEITNKVKAAIPIGKKGESEKDK